MYGFFNHFGERFQKDAVLVSGFTGFVWTACGFVWKWFETVRFLLV